MGSEMCIRDRDYEWNFHPYDKTPTNDGLGYLLESFEGDPTYVPFDSDRVRRDGLMGDLVY